MRRNLCAYLHDMLEASQAIQHFVEGFDAHTFDSDDLTRSAVERKFEIIGEALRQATQFHPGSIESIAGLRAAIGQRNQLIHGYFDVDSLIVWNSIYDDLPDFQSNVERLIAMHCKE